MILHQERWVCSATSWNVTFIDVTCVLFQVWAALKRSFNIHIAQVKEFTDEQTLECLKKARRDIPNERWGKYCAHTERLIKEHASHIIQAVNRGAKIQVVEIEVGSDSDSDTSSYCETDADVGDVPAEKVSVLNLPTSAVDKVACPDFSSLVEVKE